MDSESQANVLWHEDIDVAVIITDGPTEALIDAELPVFTKELSELVRWAGRRAVYLVCGELTPLRASDILDRAASFSSRGARICIAHEKQDATPAALFERIGKDAVEGLIDSAPPLDPLRRLELVEGSEDALSLLQDPLFLILLGGNELLRHRARMRFKALKVPVKAVDDAIKSTMKGRDDALRARRLEVDGQIDPHFAYIVENDRLCHLTVGISGRQTNVLANFAIEIREVVESHTLHGTVKTAYMIGGTLSTGHKLSDVLVDADKFDDMKWLHCWHEAAIKPGKDSRAHLATAIKILSKPLHTTRYERTGWAEYKGKKVYLWHGGSLGGDAGLTSELEGDRQRFKMPASVQDPQVALRRSFQFLAIRSLGVTGPLLGAVYLAPLYTILLPNLYIWLKGFSGAGKSCLAGILQAHFGAEWNFNQLPLAWDSTALGLRKTLGFYRDVVIATDDYIPESSSHMAVTELLHGIGNNTARTRASQDGKKLVRNDTIASLMIATAEVPPPEASGVWGRGVLIDLEQDKVAFRKAIQYSQTSRELLNEAMLVYLQWLLPKVNDDAWISQTKARLGKLESELNEALPQTSHNRCGANLGALLLGLELFLECAAELRAITPVESADTRAGVRQALIEQGTGQASDTEAMSEADRYLEGLCSMMVSGEVVLLDKGVAPEAYKGRATLIGWADEDHWYLVPPLAFKAVSEFYGQTGRSPWTYSKQAVHQELVHKGYVLRLGKEIPHPQWVGGATRRVLKLPRLRDPITNAEKYPIIVRLQLDDEDCGLVPMRRH